jgi:hypothetical protein
MFTLKFKLIDSYPINLMQELIILSTKLHYSTITTHSKFIFSELIVKNSNVIYFKLTNNFRLEYINNAYYLHLVFEQKEFDASYISKIINFVENVLQYDNCKISVYSEALIQELTFESVDI